MISITSRFILKSALENGLVPMNFMELSIILGGLFIVFISYMIFKIIWVNVLTETRVALYITVFYGIISVYFLDSPNNVVFLLACVCLFSSCLSCVFLLLLRLKERKNTQSDYDKLKDYLYSVYNSEAYTNLIFFWEHNFKQRSKTKEKNKIWEYPLISIASFYTVIRTRLLFVQNVYLVRATCLCLTGHYFWLLIYLVPMVLVTVVFAIPSVQKYFWEIYGVDSVKKLGWNAFRIALQKAGATVGGTVVGSLAGLAGATAADNRISPPLNWAQFKRESNYFDIAHAMWERNGKLGLEPIPPNYNQIIDQRLLPTSIFYMTYIAKNNWPKD